MAQTLSRKQKQWTDENYRILGPRFCFPAEMRNPAVASKVVVNESPPSARDL